MRVSWYAVSVSQWHPRPVWLIMAHAPIGSKACHGWIVALKADRLKYLDLMNGRIMIDVIG